MDPTNPRGEADPGPELDDAPLPPGAEPDAIDEDGDDASPVCLRCFTPLVGAPTRCPNCAAPASLAATLGPSAGGGVDVGGTDAHTLPRARDGRLSAWAYALIWGGGLVVLPNLCLLLVALLSASSSGSEIAPKSTIVAVLVGVPLLWTLVFGWLMLRAKAP